MTREEAIGKLEEEKEYYVKYLSAGKIIGKVEEWGKAIEAYDMAIEALKQPEIIRCKDCKYCEEVNPGLFYCDSVDIVPVGQYVEPDGFCSMARRREQ